MLKRAVAKKSVLSSNFSYCDFVGAMGNSECAYYMDLGSVPKFAEAREEILLIEKYSELIMRTNRFQEWRLDSMIGVET